MTIDERRDQRDRLHRQIAALNREGLSDCDIARMLGVNRKTVREALDRPAKELRP